MPLSVLEAFASGLPAVSTNVGGVPAILRDGVDGLLVPDDDDAALADQVERLLASPEFARTLAASARDTLAAYDWPVVREGWIRAYSGIRDSGFGIRPADRTPITIESRIPHPESRP
jgi:glycosyltransferase involved in cell wall biosynthesis